MKRIYAIGMVTVLIASMMALTVSADTVARNDEENPFNFLEGYVDDEKQYVDNEYHDTEAEKVITYTYDTGIQTMATMGEIENNTRVPVNVAYHGTSATNNGNPHARYFNGAMWVEEPTRWMTTRTVTTTTTTSYIEMGKDGQFSGKESFVIVVASEKPMDGGRVDYRKDTTPSLVASNISDRLVYLDEQDGYYYYYSVVFDSTDYATATSIRFVNSRGNFETGDTIYYCTYVMDNAYEKPTQEGFYAGVNAFVNNSLQMATSVINWCTSNWVVMVGLISVVAMFGFGIVSRFVKGL